MKHESKDTPVRCEPRTPSCRSSGKLSRPRWPSRSANQVLSDFYGRNVRMRVVWNAATTHRIYLAVTFRDLRWALKATAIHRQGRLQVTRWSHHDTIQASLAHPHGRAGVGWYSAITGSGDSSDLDRRLAGVSGTTCSWRGTPSPPSTTGAWKRGIGVSFGNFNQDREAGCTVRSSHLRYLANDEGRGSWWWHLGKRWCVAM